MGTTPLTQKDILNILKELIITHDNNRLGLEYYDIRITSTLTDLGFDSLDIPEFSMNVESKFKIRIEDEEVEQIFMRKTIEEIMTFVHKKINHKS